MKIRGTQEGPVVGSGKACSLHYHLVLPEGPETLTTEGPWSLASGL